MFKEKLKSMNATEENVTDMYPEQKRKSVYIFKMKSLFLKGKLTLKNIIVNSLIGSITTMN